MPSPIHSTSQTNLCTQASTPQPIDKSSNAFSRITKGLSLLLLGATQPAALVGGASALVGIAAWAIKGTSTERSTGNSMVAITPLGKNPNPRGIELLVIDENSTAGSHGDRVSFVANAALLPNSNTETLLLKEDFNILECELSHVLMKIANMKNPPEVISMSLGSTPARRFNDRMSNANNQFFRIYGDHSDSWTPAVWDAYKNVINAVALEAVGALDQWLNKRCMNQADVQAVEIPKAFQALVKAGVTVVVCSGNDGAEADSLTALGLPIPKDFFKSIAYLDGKALPDGVIVVGASGFGLNGEVKAARFSNPDPAVDVGANGDNVPCNKQGMTMGGTSAATPQVAALAANILSINPKLSPAQVEKIIVSTATAIEGDEDRLGAGVINPEKAYQMAKESRTPQS